MKTKCGGISGYIEEEEPIKRALKEIEESGLNDKNVTVLRIGEPLEAVESNEPEITWMLEHGAKMTFAMTLDLTTQAHDIYRIYMRL